MSGTDLNLHEQSTCPGASGEEEPRAPGSPELMPDKIKAFLLPVIWKEQIQAGRLDKWVGIEMVAVKVGHGA